MASGGRRFSTGAVAAGATTANLLADSTLRYPGEDSALEVAATTEAAGLLDQTIIVEVGNQLVYDGILGVEQTVGGGPRLPDNVLVRTGVGRGDQISVRVRNDDAVATPISVALIDVTPV